MSFFIKHCNVKSGVFLVCIFGLVLRIPFLDVLLTDDEAISPITPFSEAITTYLGHTNHIFHEILTRGMIKVFGLHYVTIRLVSLMAGICSIYLVYYFGKKLHSEFAGLLAGVLLASSYPLVEYSIRSEGYSLYILFTILALIISRNILRRRNPSLLDWSLFAVILSFGLYTIPIMLYPMGVCCSWILLEWTLFDRENLMSKLGSLLLSVAGTGGITLFLFSPVFYYQGTSFIVENRFIKPLTYGGWTSKLVTVFKENVLLWTGNGSLIIVTLFAVGVIGLLVTSNKHQIFTLLGVSILFPLSFSLIYPVVMPPRGWLFLLPIIYVLVAVGYSNVLETYASNFFKTEYYKELFVVIALFLLSVVGQLSFFIEFQQKPTMKQAEQIVETLSKPGHKKALLVNPFNDSQFEYILNNPTLDQERVVAHIEHGKQYFVTLSHQRSLKHIKARYTLLDESINDKAVLISNDIGKVLYLSISSEEHHRFPKGF